MKKMYLSEKNFAIELIYLMINYKIICYKIIKLILHVHYKTKVNYLS